MVHKVVETDNCIYLSNEMIVKGLGKSDQVLWNML